MPATDTTTNPQVVLGAGASSGFGRLTAETLTRDGSEVVVAVYDRLRVEFFRRVGLEDLLPALARL